MTGQAARLGRCLRVALWPVLLASAAVGAVFVVAAPVLAEALGGGGEAELVTRCGCWPSSCRWRRVSDAVHRGHPRLPA